MHPLCRLRLPAWIALVALLASALWPTLSHALALQGATRWVEICTAQGMRLVAVADLGDAHADRDAGRLQGAMDHCPYCALGAQGAMAPPPTPIAPARALPARADAPPRRLSSPHSLPPWCGVQPRAPPSLA